MVALQTDHEGQGHGWGGPQRNKFEKVQVTRARGVPKWTSFNGSYDMGTPPVKSFTYPEIGDTSFRRALNNG